MIKSRIDLVKHQRDNRATDGGVLVNGKWFSTSANSRSSYISIASSGQADDTIIAPDWRTMEPGVTVKMTPALAKEILAAIVNMQVDNDKNCRDLISKIDHDDFNPLSGWVKAFWER
jgi:hypothetical protein